MIESKHRVAALAALCNDAQLEEVIPPDVWEILVREGQVSHNFTQKKAAPIAITEAGMGFLRRALA